MGEPSKTFYIITILYCALLGQFRTLWKFSFFFFYYYSLMIFFFFFKNLCCFSIRRGLTLISVGLDQLSTTRTSSRQGFPNHGERSPEISFFYLAFSIVSVTGVSHLGLGHAKLNRKRTRHESSYTGPLSSCHAFGMRGTAGCPLPPNKLYSRDYRSLSLSSCSSHKLPLSNSFTSLPQVKLPSCRHLCWNSTIKNNIFERKNKASSAL